MSRSYKVQKLEKKLLAKRAEIKNLEASKDKLFLTLGSLTEQYEQGKITHEHYSALWSTYLSGRSIEDWVAYYNYHAEELEKQYLVIHAEINTTRDSVERVAIVGTLSMAVILMLVLVGTISQLGGLSGLVDITGAAVTDNESTYTEVMINAYFAIAASENITNGITFGTLTDGTNDNNATNNWDGAGDNSTMYIAISSDSNVETETCVGANESYIHTITAGKSMGIGNLTWSNSTDGAPSGPAGSTPMTVANATVATEIAGGTDVFFRFWLDVPTDQWGGKYQNTLYFTTTQNGTDCRT